MIMNEKAGQSEQGSLVKERGNFFWKERTGGKTDMSQELGKLLEEYYLDK